MRVKHSLWKLCLTGAAVALTVTPGGPLKRLGPARNIAHMIIWNRLGKIK